MFVASPSARSGRAYLDHAASTPMWPETFEAMLPWYRPEAGGHGNPSGVHREARAARAALEEARDCVADAFGASPHEVVFTSGGTEALNLAVRGVVEARSADGHDADIAISAIEHDAVRQPAFALARARRALLSEIAASADGVVDVGAIAGYGGLVAVMAVNNEVGTIQPIADVRLAAPAAVLLVDAVCAVPWLDIRSIWTAGADLVAISAHKFGGPKGIGALLVRSGVALDPQLRGGGQEHERRSGTPNVAAAVGMAMALRMTSEGRASTVARTLALRDRLVDELLARIPGSAETGDRTVKAAGHAHLCIDGVESEALLMLLDRADVAASAGSACASGALHASHVLLAMGVPRSRALGSLRLTLGATTTCADIDLAVSAVPAAVATLRGS